MLLGDSISSCAIRPGHGDLGERIRFGRDGAAMFGEPETFLMPPEIVFEIARPPDTRNETSFLQARAEVLPEDMGGII